MLAEGLHVRLEVTLEAHRDHGLQPDTQGQGVDLGLEAGDDPGLLQHPRAHEASGRR